MKDKEKIDTLSDLYNKAWSSFDTRRSYEWKTNFGLWAALGSILGFSIKEKNTFEDRYVWLVISIIAVAYVFIWTVGLFTQNRKDKDRMGYYQEKILRLLRLGEIPPYVFLWPKDKNRGKEAGNQEKNEVKNPSSLKQSWDKIKDYFIRFKECICDWSHLSQIIFTLALLAAVGVQLTRSDDEKKSISVPIFTLSTEIYPFNDGDTTLTCKAESLALSFFILNQTNLMSDTVHNIVLIGRVDKRILLNPYLNTFGSNENLARCRALALKNYLLNLFPREKRSLMDKKIIILSSGSNFIGNDATKTNMEKDRCVDIFLYK